MPCMTIHNECVCIIKFKNSIFKNPRLIYYICNSNFSKIEYALLRGIINDKEIIFYNYIGISDLWYLYEYISLEVFEPFEAFGSLITCSILFENIENYKNMFKYYKNQKTQSISKSIFINGDIFIKN